MKERSATPETVDCRWWSASLAPQVDIITVNTPCNRWFYLRATRETTTQRRQDTKMPNPNTERSEQVSTTTNQSNSNGVAQHTRPVFQTSVEEATNHIVEAAIASKEKREAEAQAQAAAHTHAQAAAFAQAQAQAYRHAQARAQRATQAATQAQAHAEAVAQRAQEIRDIFEHTMQRTVREALSGADRQAREESSKAVHTHGPWTDKDRMERGDIMVGGEEPRPSPPPAKEAYHHCDSDHCDGSCTFLKD